MLSKEAARRFVTKGYIQLIISFKLFTVSYYILPNRYFNPSLCRHDHYGAEDAEMGEMIKTSCRFGLPNLYQ